MEPTRLILISGLLFLGLASLTWLGSKVLLKQKARFADATLASLLMVLIGGAAAAALGLVYQAFRPLDAAKPVQSYRVLGEWVALDFALVSLLGLLAGYAFAFNITLGGRWSRRVLLAFLAAVVTPLILMGAERLVDSGATAVALVH